VLLTVVSAAHEQRMKAEAKATVQARSASDFQSAVSKLLSTIYDIVIELDEHMKILGRAETLAGFLLHGPHRQLQGSLFQDFMYDADDKADFERHLVEARTKPHSGHLQSLAIPVRLRLRDSSGNTLRVELLHAEFQDLNLNSHYLIGIRDITDGLPASHTLDPAMLADAFGAPPFQLPAARVIGAPRQNQNRIVKARRGTPATPPHGCFTSSLADISDTSQFALSQLMLPHFRPTSSEVVKASLVQILLRWNLDQTNSWCCSWHFVIYVAMSHLRMLQRGGCFSSHEVLAEWQCPRCGMMDESASAALYSFASKRCKWCETLDLADPETSEEAQDGEVEHS
ncbi:unnamed protein product, partial [Polarella glacialis]